MRAHLRHYFLHYLRFPCATVPKGANSKAGRPRLSANPPVVLWTSNWWSLLPPMHQKIALPPRDVNLCASWTPTATFDHSPCPKTSTRGSPGADQHSSWHMSSLFKRLFTSSKGHPSMAASSDQQSTNGSTEQKKKKLLRRLALVHLQPSYWCKLTQAVFIGTKWSRASVGSFRLWA